MRKYIAFAVVLVFVIAGGTAFTQSSEDNVYTGCLQDNGHLYQVAIGNEPVAPCKPGETQISWNAEGPPGGLFQTYERTHTWDIYPGVRLVYDVTCDEPGDAVVGGGYNLSTGMVIPDWLRVVGSYPGTANGHGIPGWAVEVEHTGEHGPFYVTVYAICLDLTP